MQAKVGRRVPQAKLARMVDNVVEPVDLEGLLTGRRVVLVGLPGAFTPVCTGAHLPRLIQSAPLLKASGIEEILCTAPNSPWVVQEWSDRIDPEGVLTFLSDGNLELARGAGLTTRAPELFLGECSRRFSMIVRDAVIEKLAVETRIDVIDCTEPTRLLQ